MPRLGQREHAACGQSPRGQRVSSWGNWIGPTSPRSAALSRGAASLPLRRRVRWPPPPGAPGAVVLSWVSACRAEALGRCLSGRPCSGTMSGSVCRDGGEVSPCAR